MQALIDFDGWKTWKKSAHDMAAADALKAMQMKKQGTGRNVVVKGKKL